MSVAAHHQPGTRKPAVVLVPRNAPWAPAAPRAGAAPRADTAPRAGAATATPDAIGKLWRLPS